MEQSMPGFLFFGIKGYGVGVDCLIRWFGFEHQTRETDVQSFE